MNEFIEKTQEEHRQITSNYMPNARAFAAKNYKESNLYKLLLGISNAFKDLDDLFCTDWKNLNILTTDNEEYLYLWESSLGMPDKIFKQTTGLSLQKRKEQIITKLTSLGTLTIADMKALANILGLQVEISTGTKQALPPYSVPFTPVGSRSKWLLFVTSKDFNLDDLPPYSVPFVPAGVTSILEDLFNAIKPSNSLLIVN